MVNNILHISESLRCSSCGACNVICPVSAISFGWSSMGRKYTKVDQDKCTNCGLCRRVCPSINEDLLAKGLDDSYVGNIKNVYVGRSLDEIIYSNSQSGGLCTSVLSFLFQTGQIDAAIVTSMQIGNPPTVQAKVITKKEDLLSSQKSCYTPVDVLSALKYTKKYKSVAVVGLPCHIQGLTRLKESSKLFDNVTFKLGLICDRTLCARILDVIQAFVHEGGKDMQIEWRKKNFYYNGTHYTYKNAPMVVTFGKKKYIIPRKARFSLKDFFTAPRCRECKDKLNNHSDLVFGDPWRMPNYDEVNGDSLVIVRSSRGQLILDNMIKNRLISLDIRNVDQLIKGQLIEERRNLNLKQIDKYYRDFKDKESLSEEQIVVTTQHPQF